MYMCSLVMSPFSHNYIKVQIDCKYRPCFELLTSVQYSYSTWFLGVRTSMLVCNNLCKNSFYMI